MDRTLEIEEFMKEMMIDCAEFSVWGMLNASEEVECPGFWIGTYLSPRDLREMTEIFGSRYYFYDPKFLYN